MTKININLNNKFYTRNAIETALSDFSHICDGKVISNDFEVELIPKEQDLSNLDKEFSQYVFGLMMNDSEEIDSTVKSTPTSLICGSQGFIENFVRTKKFNDKYLFVTDFGKWEILNEEEFGSYKRGSYTNNPEVYRKLKENSIILDESNIATCISEARKKKQFLLQGTSLHIINLTNRCNFNCSYCQTSAKDDQNEGYDLDIPTAKQTVDVIFQSPSNSIMIEFQGGEPLLNFETLKFIVEYAQNKNRKAKKDLKMSIVTNFSLMDEEKLEFLIDNDVSLCTSLDGPEEIHNKCRQDYALVNKWIKKTQQTLKQKNSKHNLHALLTVTKYSLNNYKKIIDEYVNQGFNKIFLRFMNELGHAEKEHSLSYSAEEFIKFWQKSLDYILELNKQGTSFMEWKTLYILKKLYDDKDPNYADLRSPCGAVIGQLLYNYDGKVYTCDEGRMIEDDVFQLGDISQNYSELTTCSGACNMIAASINDTDYCDKCVYKPFCGICPVLNYAKTGSIITNIPSSFWCKIHKAQFDYIFKKIMEDKKGKEIFESWVNLNIDKQGSGYR